MKKSFTLPDWIAHLKSGKDIYHSKELERLSGLSKEALHRALQRMRKNKIIFKIGKGLYANSFHVPQLEQIGGYLYSPSYISLESALFHHGVIEQAPFVLTCVTTNKTKRFHTDLGEIHYSHLKQKHFFGYTFEGQFPLASPEKAAIDYVYLQLKAGNKPPLDEWNWENLETGIIEDIWKEYPKSVKTYFSKFAAF